ncbi:uncharacterized protein LOC131614987 [Vicia villosa]|uniref:uncharacterized protein LOC131614987 n=1 Tax=Vicia villosa TaxID=3911 RepID=UPI00273B037E|nr:uncharacterized protein LOC131614987 [Vicia villosa]
MVKKNNKSNGSGKMVDAKAMAPVSMGKAKTIAILGADKEKSAAMVGAQKVKSGTSAGFKWIKNLCKKKNCFSAYIIHSFITYTKNLRSQALCQGYPTEIASYFHHCRSLRIDDKPDDIGGRDIQKQEICEAVKLPLTHHNLYKQIGIDTPRGVLLCGPLGTSKIMLAKADANHTTAAFIRVMGSEFVQKYLGEILQLQFNYIKEYQMLGGKYIKLLQNVDTAQTCEIA